MTAFRYVDPEKTKKRTLKINYMQYDISGLGNGSQDQRAFYPEKKHGCLDTCYGKAKILKPDGRVRHTTPTECERLQTVPDGYTAKAGTSNTQRYRMLGNGWTIDVISHILKNMKTPKKIRVLSLFDGMSCGQIALNRAGFDVESYSASEIDKYAMAVAMANYPNTIQLGDITQVTGLDVDRINLLMGGSPCQGFSFAGKQLNFEDPRSKLFFDFVKLLREVEPKYFLLENVKMKKESQDVISGYLGVEPIEINSALVSAQNRKRLYWTNIPDVTQPEDKGIFLKDIIEDGFVDREKSYCIDANYVNTGNGNPKQYFEKSRRQLVFTEVVGARQVGRRLGKDGKREDHDTSLKAIQRIELRNDQKTNCLSTMQKDNFLAFAAPVQVGLATDVKGHDILKRVYSTEGKSPTLTAASGGNLEKKIAVSETHYRKLTPTECERLQTVPDGYTAKAGTSNTQRYRMLGNGWTIDVISHILKNMQL